MDQAQRAAYVAALRNVAADLLHLSNMAAQGVEGNFTPDSGGTYTVEAAGAIWDLLKADGVVS